jgi:hypothetical protein
VCGGFFSTFNRQRELAPCFEHYLDKKTTSNRLLTVHLTEADTPTVDKQIKVLKRAQVKGFLGMVPINGAKMCGEHSGEEINKMLSRGLLYGRTTSSC